MAMLRIRTMSPEEMAREMIDEVSHLFPLALAKNVKGLVVPFQWRDGAHQIRAVMEVRVDPVAEEGPGGGEGVLYAA